MKRWLAVTVTGAVLALGAPAGAQESTGTHIEVGAFKRLTADEQKAFLVGMMDGLLGSGRFTCGAIRRAAVIAQVTALVTESPREKIISVLITALEQLGCTDILAEKPSAKPAYSGPSS